jgi:magnesium chelatase subunit I
MTYHKKARQTNTTSAPRPVFPFSAIVGQEEMKLALILTVIDPHIGGVMIMGHRGTGKSTAVRSLADLLPPIARIKGCLYGCDPARPEEFCDDCMDRVERGEKLAREIGSVRVIDLPLGATEDRVCGTLDIERALTEGVKAFEPGLLAKANRGFLYIDEVNLLEDHLVDVLLDAAASGSNIVEREGISVRHPARFVLVGSGNPEEGDLRPQLLDRFGLHAQISTITDLDQRVEIVERRERFDRDAAAFRGEFNSEQDRIRKRISRARKSLLTVDLPRELMIKIAQLCAELRIDGHRGELTLSRAARALAAFEGRSIVRPDDAERVSVMSLRHRLRRDPLESIDSGVRIQQAAAKIFSSASGSRLAAIK